MNSLKSKKGKSPSRLHWRYSAYSNLSIAYEGYNEDIPVHVPDLSTQGIFINTARAFPEGAVLNVQFRLTRTGADVKARGEVRYCLPGVGIGVEFVDISREAQQAIERELGIEAPQLP